MYAFTLPPPPRVVDDINVKRPAFYGDTGGPGWYAESQYPVRRRLAVEYKPRWGRDVYIRPTELILPALKLPIDLESIRAKFERFNLISAEVMDRSVVSVMLRFASEADARAALHDSESARLRGERKFRADTPEVNVQGKIAFTLADILLVREASATDHFHVFGGHTFHSLATILETSPAKQGKGAKRSLSLSPRVNNRDHREKRHRSEKEYHRSGEGRDSLHKAVNHYKLEQVSPPNPFAALPDRPQVAPPTPPASASYLTANIVPHRESTFRSQPAPPTLGPLHRFEEHLQLSSNGSYAQHPLPPWPAWFATSGNDLLIGLTAQHILDRHPGVSPVHIDDLPPSVREQLGMREVHGYRWEVKYDTQEQWRVGGGYLELRPGM